MNEAPEAGNRELKDILLRDYLKDEIHYAPNVAG